MRNEAASYHYKQTHTGVAGMKSVVVTRRVKSAGSGSVRIAGQHISLH